MAGALPAGLAVDAAGGLPRQKLFGGGTHGYASRSHSGIGSILRYFYAIIHLN